MFAPPPLWHRPGHKRGAKAEHPQNIAEKFPEDPKTLASRVCEKINEGKESKLIINLVYNFIVVKLFPEFAKLN